MSSTFLNGPFLHLMSNYICCFEVKIFSLFNRLSQVLINFLWQTLLHDCIIKYIFSKDFSYVDYFCAHTYPFLFIDSCRIQVPL